MKSAGTASESLTAPADISACDREPIHIPGSIQPHGFLLALSPEGEILQASANAAECIGTPGRKPVGRTLAEALPDDVARCVLDAIAAQPLERYPKFLCGVRLGGRVFQTLGHRSDGVSVLEFEAAEDEQPSFQFLYPVLRSFVSKVEDIHDPDELTRVGATEVRQVTGFDRVLIYKFDEDWNGTVVAEDRNERLPSYLGLRFPASDIPRQARELYRLNRLRLISDASYAPVPIEPATDPRNGRPLDMSHCSLRSVSPVHAEYMRNMGTPASMSISLMQGDRLWGLISCHHAEPRRVSYAIRTACDFIGQVLSMQIASRERASEQEYRMHLRSVHAKLLAFMAREADFQDGVVKHPRELLEATAASGAALVFGGNVWLRGQTPTESQVRALVDWLAKDVGREVYWTDSLGSAYPPAAEYTEDASGLLSIEISKLHRSYLLWFRPEVLRTIEWGGDPRKPMTEGDGSGRLNPRRSFETWKEVVRGRAPAWRQSEIDAAAEFRNAIIGIGLRKAEEMAALNAELKRSNSELEAFSYSVSHDLRAPFRHIVGFAELLRETHGEDLSDSGRRYINIIMESAKYAGTLVDNLLAFSQMGRQSLTMGPVDMNQLVREVQTDVMFEAEGRKVRWEVGDLGTAEADATMLRLALRNLLSNAVKYTKNRGEAHIRIQRSDNEHEAVFSVQDNGIGFDMTYVDKLFGVFQRLHKMEDYDGTGIGLANVRRIVSRHGGRTWAEGVVDAGATFSFSLPRSQRSEDA